MMLNTFKICEQLVECMVRISDDMAALAKIIAEQQQQILTLTNCVEQLQEIILDDLD